MKKTINLNSLKASFFESSLSDKTNEALQIRAFYEWYNQRLSHGFFEISVIPFKEFDKWSFTPHKSEIVHDSGKFFRIEGLRVLTNFGEVAQWDQPIINQPEIGILGIITKIIDGIRYFLIQVKMEPGNINILQVSPTLQATKSNFTKVHKGKSPEYLEYFIDRKRSRILIDQLQTEQGGRFLRKRNRNMVVEITDDIELHEDFKWLTLAEIKILLTHANIVNMDARSVISTIPLIDEQLKNEFEKENIADFSSVVINGNEIKDFGLDVLKSICSQTPLFTEDELLSWLTQQKVDYELETTKIALTELHDWKISENAIFNNDRFFSVIGVKVATGTREVASWTQPLIYDNNIGLLGFVTAKIEGILHFLVQAKVEPGHIDIVELSPTVSCSNYEHVFKTSTNIPFIDQFKPETSKTIHFDTIQSEEGGRFHQMQNRNMIIELAIHELGEIPNNYKWMTLNQIMDFMKFGLFNIEARSIISSLKFN
jgi:oxidase EvaA